MSLSVMYWQGNETDSDLSLGENVRLKKVSLLVWDLNWDNRGKYFYPEGRSYEADVII